MAILLEHQSQMEGEVYLGDFGINAAKIKTVNIKRAEEFNMKGLNVVTSLQNNPAESRIFLLKIFTGIFFRSFKAAFFGKKNEC